MANKWLISPQSRKIFILFGFLLSATRRKNEDVARDVLWENPEGEVSIKDPYMSYCKKGLDNQWSLQEVQMGLKRSHKKTTKKHIT